MSDSSTTPARTTAPEMTDAIAMVQVFGSVVAATILRRLGPRHAFPRASRLTFVPLASIRCGASPRQIAETVSTFWAVAHAGSVVIVWRWFRRQTPYASKELT